MRNGAYFETETGIELYYEVTGEGAPLIFVPGWTFTTEIFDRQVSHFSDSYKVVSFDPRSQGRSTITPQGNDYTTQSADLAKLIDHLGLVDPVIIGWSYGSLTLWGLVRLQGVKSLKGLVFIDLPPVPVSGKDEWVEFSVEQAADSYQSLTTAEGHREWVTSYAKNTMVQGNLSSEELNWVVSQSIKSPPWAAAAYCAAGMFSNYEREAQEVDRTMKTMFVVAESSEQIARAYLETKLPNSDVEFLGGHVMFWEFSEKFNAILENYLGELD